MFENPRRGRQARNFTINVPKILDLQSSSEQIFSENWRWVPLVHFILNMHWSVHSKSLRLQPARRHAGSTNVFFFLTDRAIFVWPWKMVSISVCYLFYQPMDDKNKTWTLRFPAKENPNMERALFDWPIVLQCDVKAISRKFFGHEVFSAERSLNQPKARCVCIRSINQSNRFISVRLLFLFCSRVFISRSYENRSKGKLII